MSGYLTSNVRRPRCRILVSGIEIEGCQSVEVFISNQCQAGSFFAQVAVRTAVIETAAPWYEADTIDVSVQMGFLPAGQPEGLLKWQEMISGRVDRIRFDPVKGLVTVEGRDYAARLLDLPLTQGFLNNRSSEVAEQLAARCGLSASVNPTSEIIGQYYQIEHARVALARFSRFGTAWDLLSSLAQLEGYDLWVQGLNLYFQPQSSSSAVMHQIDLLASTQTSASPSLNVSSLVVERSLALNGGLPVLVTSWNSRQRMRVSAQAGSTQAGQTPFLSVVRPNLLQDTAQALADGIFGQTNGHQRTLVATAPGELSMSPRDGVQLTGAGPAWDGNFVIDTVEREMTLAGGFVQRFTAKTTSA